MCCSGRVPPAAHAGRRGPTSRADAPTLSPPARQWPGFSQIFSSRRSQILFSSSRPAGRRQCAAIGSLAQHEMRAHSYTIANDAGGWRGRDLPYARRRWGALQMDAVGRQRASFNSSRLSRALVRGDAAAANKRFAIVGDSINWSMIQSLWKLLSLNGRNSDPPGRRPPSRLVTVDCSGRTVELLWAGSNHLNASLIAETVATSDVTLINGGPVVLARKRGDE